MTKGDDIHAPASLTLERKTLNWTLGDTHRRSGNFGEEKIPLTLLRLQTTIPKLANLYYYSLNQLS